MAEGEPSNRGSWLDRHLWQIQPVRDVGVVAAVFGLFWLGYKLSVVTVPVLLAIALAYLFEPVVRWLTRQRVFGRQGAAAFIIAVLTLVTVVPVGVGGTFAVLQGVDLVTQLADDAQTFREAIKEENLDSPTYRDAVSGQPWTWLLETIESERARQQELRAELEAQAEEDAAAAEQGLDAGQTPPVPDELAHAAVPPAADDPLTNQPAEIAEDADVVDPEAAAEAARLAAEEREQRRAQRARRILELSQPTDMERTVTLVAGFIENNASAISARVARTGAGAFESFVGLLTSFGVLGFTFFLTCFFFFFVSTGYSKVLAFGESLIPAAHRGLTLHLLRRCDKVIAGFIRGRLTIAFVQAIVFSIAYWVIGVPAPLLLGMGVALLSIVPYAALVGIPVSVVLLWLESHSGFRGEIWWVLGAPLVVYFVGQALDDYVWTPLIQGKSTGMDTPTILFATLAGGALMGVYGLLLAIPLAACLKILLEEIFWPRFKQWAAGEKPDFLPLSKE